MTASKPKTAPVVAQAAARASVPKRQVVKHTVLFRAELQAAHIKANNALLAADAALSAAADSRDADIALANQRFEAIRLELDAERNDILKSMEGIEAALKATDDKPAVPTVAKAA